MSSSPTNTINPSPHRPKRPTRGVPPLPISIDNDSDPPPLPDPVSSSSNSVPLLSSPVSLENSLDNQTDLTPLRAHYLKKSLIQLQFNRELDAITTSAPNNVSTFSYLGPPFSPPPRGAPPLDLPFLRYIFRQFVLTFPFMAAAPKDFYSEKLQPFVASALSRNLSPTSIFDDVSDPSEQATRLKLLTKLERNLSLFLGAATKLVEREQVVRLSQADLDRLQMLARKRIARNLKPKDIFEVNIVGVRTVVDKGRMRSRVHEEFIIRTRRSRYSDVFVSRRYGDFKTLEMELRKVHPDEPIPSPPVKDRTTVNVPSNTAPLSSPPSFSHQFSDPRSLEPNSPRSSQPSSSNAAPPPRLTREKNRLTLRAYLFSLLSSFTIASSPVLKSFLLSGPTTLTQEELEDAQRREEADKVREDSRRRFATEISSRVDGLRDAVKDVKGDISGKDGLTHIFGIVKVTPDVRDLPQNYQAVLEWARISLASTVFHQYVASDNSSETFASLKRIHGLMPYFMLKAALKISNPIGMIRSVLDLFLAQPFGGKSLLQRMFTSSLMEEVKALEEHIEAVKDKVQDPVMCEKIRRFVHSPKEIQGTFKADAAAESLNLLTVILRSVDEPALTRTQIHRVGRAQRAHAEYLRHRNLSVDSDDDDGPHDDDAWLYEDLKVLTHLYSRLRDREQLIGLIFEGFTAELLKDIITIFYAPLAQVYRAASIADSLSDLQNFINDLIKTVEQVEDLSREDPHRTVQAFIDLIQRHEQAFYHFVHKVHSKGEGLFDSLIRWIELFLNIAREGLGEPISLEFLLPHTGQERENILKEVDAVAAYHYKLKLIYEDKLRRRFGRAQGQQNDVDAEEEAAQALVNGVVGQISVGELLRGDADALAAQETDESEEGDSSEYDSSTGSYDDDSEESSEESVVERKQIRPPQAATATPSPHTSTLPTPPARDQRPKSLKTSRSFTFLRHQVSQPSLPRSSNDLSDAPPVPRLPPKNRDVTALSKPLPQSPLHTPSLERVASLPSPRKHREPPAPPRNSKRKKTSEILKPPELYHIPQLLPVFAELIRPLLRPRQRTNPA